MTTTPVPARTTSDPAGSAPDLAAVKERQRRMWAAGDFSAVAARIAASAEAFVEAADLVPGSRVLDVACGSGNAAVAAARCDCEVVGVDYVPSLLERGRERAAAERLPVTFVEADAEALPFPDASFDAVLSIYGVMFAPDQPLAAAELLRVLRPGGTVALASWTPDGFIGDLLRTVAAHVPPPAGVASPLRWGVAPVVTELLGSGVRDLTTTERTFTFRFTSAEELTSFFRTTYGPTVTAFGALDEAGRERLHADMVALVQRSTRAARSSSGQDVAVPATYLQVVAARA